MAWIEVHQSVTTHRKTIAAAELLDIPEPHMVGHLVTFWLWALDNAQPETGELPKATARLIARAAQWDGNASTFLETLVAVGFLDDNDGVISVHDWDDYAGRLLDRRATERERSRQRRAAARGEQADRHTTGGQPADVGQTTVGTNPTNQPYNPPTPQGAADKPRENDSVSDIRLVSNGHPPDIERTAQVTTKQTTNTNNPILRTAPDKPARKRAEGKSRPPDLWFDQMTALFGMDAHPLNDIERGRVNTACKQIRDAGGRPEQLVRALEEFHRLYPKATPTPMALAGNWSQLVNGARAPARRLEDAYPAV